MMDFARALPRLRRRVLRTLRAGDDLRRGSRARRARSACSTSGCSAIGFRAVRGRRGRRRSRHGRSRTTSPWSDGEAVFDYLGQGRGPPRPGRRKTRPSSICCARSSAAAVRRRPAAGLPGGPPLARRPLGADQRVPQEPDRRRSSAPRTSAPGTPPCWRRCPWRPTGGMPPPGGAQARNRRGAVRGVAEVLGNTPAVARRAYIDPRVFDRYLSGWTIGGELDRIGSLRGPDDRRRGSARARRAGPARRRSRLAGGRNTSAHGPRRREPFADSSTDTATYRGSRARCDRTRAVCDFGRSAMAVTSPPVLAVSSGELFDRWHRQRDVRARDELIERFLPLARKLARRYAASNEPYDDLVQVASLGLSRRWSGSTRPAASRSPRSRCRRSSASSSATSATARGRCTSTAARRSGRARSPTPAAR